MNERMTEAASMGNIQEVRRCIENGATNWDESIEEASKCDPLEEGQRVIAYLKSRGDPALYLQLKTESEMYHASHSKSVETIQNLLDAGATNVCECMEEAAEGGNMEVFHLLMNPKYHKGTSQYKMKLTLHNSMDVAYRGSKIPSNTNRNNCQQLVSYISLLGTPIPNYHFSVSV